MVLLGAKSSCGVISVNARAAPPYDNSAHPRIVLKVFWSTALLPGSRNQDTIIGQLARYNVLGASPTSRMKSRLTRRDFLTTGAATLCGFMTTRDTLAGTQPPGRATPQPWPQSARDFVESWQEREYRRLATALGLGSDARRAYERLSRPTVPRQAGVNVKQPPTSYEDPNRYTIMAILFDGLQRAMAQRGVALSPTPLLATLPSGDVNARIVIEPASRVPVIFFEQGLFDYLYGFVLLTAWA